MAIYNFGQGEIVINNAADVDNLKTYLENMYQGDMITIADYKDAMDKINNLEKYRVDAAEEPVVHRDFIADYDRAMKGI